MPRRTRKGDRSKPSTKPSADPSDAHTTRIHICTHTTPTIPTMERLTEEILLCPGGNCASLSQEECVGICEAILLDVEDQDHGKHANEAIIDSLRDFLDVSLEDAQDIFQKANGTYARETSDCCSNEEDDEEEEDMNDWFSDCSNESDYLQDGECEICERYMKTSRHHLIPKFTWKYMKSKLQSTASSYANGDMEMFKQILNMGLTKEDTVDNNEFLFQLSSFISPTQMSNASTVKFFLANYTANVCRACHSCLHHHIDHDTLAQSYYTVNLLLEHREVYKFSRWAHKQRPGKHSIHSNILK